MRLRHIEIFSAVMTAGTVSGAARLLNLTQSAVTQVLQSAERQLGFSLFDRVRGGRLVPSQEALALFPAIRKITTELSAVRTFARSLKRGANTQLDVLSAPALAQSVVPLCLPSFLESHPSAEVTIRCQYSHEIFESLALHQGDLGIVYHSISHPVIQEEMLGEGYLVCVGPVGTFNKRTSVTLGELSEFPIICLDPSDPIGHLVEDTCRNLGIKFSRARIFVKAYHVLVALAAARLGIVIVDSFTAYSADRRRIDVVPIEPTITIPIRAAFAATKQRSHAAREFVEALRREFEKVPPV